MTMTTTDETVLAKADAYRNSLVNRGDAIARNTDLTHEARSQKISELWREGDRKLAEYKREHAEALKVETRRLEYAAVKPPSNDPSRMASYRGALDRAATAHAGKRLRALLEEAEMTGDEDQALAAYTVALREADSETAEAYLADRPERKAAFDRYMAQAHPSTMYQFAVAQAMSLPTRPRIARGY